MTDPVYVDPLTELYHNRHRPRRDDHTDDHVLDHDDDRYWRRED